MNRAPNVRTTVQQIFKKNYSRCDILIRVLQLVYDINIFSPISNIGYNTWNTVIIIIIAQQKI